jgi:ureidoacrylate peracid hydrolase
MQEESPLREWVDPQTSALLVVDVQNDWLHPEGGFATRGLDNSLGLAMLPTLKSLIEAARNADVRVVMIRVVRNEDTEWPALERLARHYYAADYVPVFEEGWGAEFYEGFEPQPGDMRVDKTRYGAFTGTNLDLILRAKGIENIIMGGGITNVCLESSAREGFMLGYNVVIVEDACASATREMHEAALVTLRRWFGRVEKADDVVAAWAE